MYCGGLHCDAQATAANSCCWLDDAFEFDEGFLFFVGKDSCVVRFRFVPVTADHGGPFAFGKIENATATPRSAPNVLMTPPPPF